VVDLAERAGSPASSPPEKAGLYERDFVAWTKAQAEALRAAAAGGADHPLDWTKLAEEIESLGGRDRRELYSRIRTIIEPLLKLEGSAAQHPRPGWAETVGCNRVEIELLLEQSPSLAQELETAVAGEARRAAKLVRQNLKAHGELTPALEGRLKGASYTPGQVLGDWFPPEPPPP